jgi:AraC-like DNA-binding protein
VSDFRSWPGVSPAGTLWRLVLDGGEHRILPDGVMDIVCVDGRLLFAGPDTVATSVAFAAGTVSWGLRLAPGVAHALLGIPADELLAARIELPDLVRLPASVVESAHGEPAAALRRIGRTLWSQRTVDPMQLALADSLDQAARAGLSVRETAQRHGLSERSLRRLSNRLFGYGPKTLMSIHRFQRALDRARDGTPLGETAAITGYADQAHFAREARRLSGTTLSVLLN